MKPGLRAKTRLAFAASIASWALCSSPLGRAAPASAPLPTLDFEKAHAELVEVLKGFIAVDTRNPPGNETRGAQYLKAFLDHEGIASQIVEKEMGRGSLIARIKGNGKKRPLLIMGHLDVVGVESNKWTMDPLAGVTKDGYLYGRGAIDDKAMTSTCLVIFLQLHRLKTSLDRDVIFLAEAGEEGTTHVGMDFLVREHWDKIECEFALNEGGGIREENGTVRYVAVGTAEKIPRQTFLFAKGTSGHGSRPVMDNAIVHLANAVAAAGAWQPPARLNDTTRTFFERLAKISPPEEAFLYTHLEDPELGEMVQKKLWATNPTYNSMLRTSISPNRIEGGFRINVIPSEAKAWLDIRALPEEDMDAFAVRLREVINNPRVEVVVSQATRDNSPPSRLDTEMFLALERAQAKVFPEAVTVPMMLTGATDSAQLRAKGVQAYGLATIMTDEDASRMHGHDERVSVAGLRRFLEYVWCAVVDVAATKPSGL